MWELISDSCKTFIVVCDNFFNFRQTAYLESITSEKEIGKLKNSLARWGSPDEFVTDNCGQFASKTFCTFAATNGFYQFFLVAKRILKQEDKYLALMSQVVHRFKQHQSSQLVS